MCTPEEGLKAQAQHAADIQHLRTPWPHVLANTPPPVPHRSLERLLINLMENPTNARSFESGLAQGYTFAAQQSLGGPNDARYRQW